MGILSFLQNILNPKTGGREPDATLEDIGAIYKKICEVSCDGAFVVFMPTPAREGETDVLNIQFSTEHGKVGLDWYLLSQVNIKEQGQFLKICQEHSVEAKELEKNDCRYFRVEEGDLVSLCSDAITSLYPGIQGKFLDLVVEGVDWPITM